MFTIILALYLTATFTTIILLYYMDFIIFPFIIKYLIIHFQNLLIAKNIQSSSCLRPIYINNFNLIY